MFLVFGGYLNRSVRAMETNGGKNYLKISNLSDGDEIIAGIKVEYKDGIPNAYNAAKCFLVKQYNDLQSNAAAWYYPYLFEATNKGIIGGDNEGKFNPESSVTRAELLKMLFAAADIDLSDYAEFDGSIYDYNVKLAAALRECADTTKINTLGLQSYKAIVDGGANADFSNYLIQINGGAPHWAKAQMNYALAKGVINATQYFGLDYAISEECSESTGGCDIHIRRDDAAYMITQVFLEDIANIRVPTQIYRNDTNISCEKNEKWKLYKAFDDQAQLQSYTVEQVYQMYMNGVMEGDDKRYCNGKFNYSWQRYGGLYYFCDTCDWASGRDEEFLTADRC